MKKCMDNCEFYPVCMCGCFGNVYVHNHDFKNPEPSHCISTRKILTHIFNRIKNIDPNRDYDKYNQHLIKVLHASGYRHLGLIKRWTEEGVECGSKSLEI
jgi:hypothetical protein